MEEEVDPIECVRGLRTSLEFHGKAEGGGCVLVDRVEVVQPHLVGIVDAEKVSRGIVAIPVVGIATVYHGTVNDAIGKR